MDDLGGVSEDHVILAWLQAEIESADFQAYVIGNPPNPANLSTALKAARSPNLRDDQQNAYRRELISTVYGFGQGKGSFEGLGNDITWRKFRLEPAEVGEMFYARRTGPWQVLAPVTRKVAEGATNVGHVFTGDATNMVVLSLAAGICHSDKKLPELIALRRPDGVFVLLEGHARATAVVLEAHRFPSGVHAYIGDGASVANWPYL